MRAFRSVLVVGSVTAGLTFGGGSPVAGQEAFEPSMVIIAELGPMVQLDDLDRDDSRAYLGLEVGALRHYHPDGAVGLVFRKGRMDSDPVAALEARFRRYLNPSTAVDFGAGFNGAGPAFTAAFAKSDLWSASMHADLIDQASGSQWIWTPSVGLNAGEAGVWTIVGVGALAVLFEAFLRFADSARETP